CVSWCPLQRAWQCWSIRTIRMPIGIVRVLLRRLGLPRALCGHRRQRPAHHPGDIAAAAILLDRGWGKANKTAQALRAVIGTTLPASVSTLAQYAAQASISLRRLSNKSPRR